MNRPGAHLYRAAALWCAALLLNGCVSLAIGAGAAGVTAAQQERGFVGTVEDTVIRAKINERWISHNEDMFLAVGLQVNEGRVLLTGKVDQPQARLDAVRLSWQVGGVREVINEIQIAKEGEGGTFARDTWISTQLKTKILFDKDVSSINYSIETVAGVIYLMGIAQDKPELDRVTNHARNLSYVKGVVSYVQLKDDPRRKGS